MLTVRRGNAVLLTFVLFLVAWGIVNQLRGSSSAQLNNLRTAHAITSICLYAWFILLGGRLIAYFKDGQTWITSGPSMAWFLPFAFASCLWIYYFAQYIGFDGLVPNSPPSYWWLDESNSLFESTLQIFCRDKQPQPENCSLDWFKSSGLQAKFLIESYDRLVARMVAVFPAFLILICSWLGTYKRKQCE